jgi:hypothetical protein
MLPDSFIHYTKVDLMPGVPLYVYSVKGEHYSILIDTGINQMREQIMNCAVKLKILKMF